MPTETSASRDVIIKLEEELEEVAQRLLRNAFKQAGDADERENFSMLARIVRALVGEERWRRNSNQSVIDVLRLAIDRLPEKLSGRRPEQAVGDNHWKGKPERRTAEVLYGYRDEEVPPRFDDSGAELPISYKFSYVRAARSVVGLSEGGSTWRRIFMVIRQDIAAELLKLTPDAVMAYGVIDLARPEVCEAAWISRENGDSLSLTLVEPSAFVDRPELRAQFAEAVQQNKRVILLYGEGGTGKTWAAQEFTRQLDSVVVRANQPELLFDDMAQALEDRDISCAGDDGSVRRSFRKLLSGDKAPTYVVLDDVQDERELKLYLPNELRSVVVVTARTKILGTVTQVSFVKVDSLSEEQAMLFLSGYLPDASLSEKQLIYRTLGGRALAMRQACAYLARYNSVRIVDFVAALERHGNGLLEQIPDHTDVNLSHMYQEIISHVEEVSPVALRILKGISFTGRTVIQHLLDCYASLGMDKSTAPAIRDSLIMEAYSLLEDLCLVARDSGAKIPMVSIHPLTQSILRNLLRQEVNAVSYDVVRATISGEVKLKTDEKTERNDLWYGEVRARLRDQYYEVIRVRGMLLRSESSKRAFRGAMELMYKRFSDEVYWRWGTAHNDVMAIDEIRNFIDYYPPTLRPYLKMKLEDVPNLQSQIAAWREANGGKYPF